VTGPNGGTRFNDDVRLEALRDYRILDTPNEQSFDHLVALTARLFNVPIALVGLMDEHRQWFKAQCGLNVNEAPREYTFCDHAIRADARLLVPDALQDPRFSHHPLVLGDPKIRFYCGVPLRTPEGHALGTLCIVDYTPRVLDAQELDLLESLARQVEVELEIRRRLSLLEETLQESVSLNKSRELFATMIVHDMRSPLTAIMGLASTIRGADVESEADLAVLFAEADRVRRMLMDMLDVCLHGVGGLKPRCRVFPVTRVAEDVLARLRRSGLNANTTCKLETSDEPLLVNADAELVTRVLDNLVGNAIKHASGPAHVFLRFHLLPSGRVGCEVEDRGDVITEAVRSNIFEPFVQGPGARRGHGLGLAFCNLAVDCHGGSISVRPNPDGIGNTFYFDLPGA
jgi:two-component system, sensor histidine kinase